MTTATSTAGHIFDTLSRVNVNEHIEKKNGLSYLSWAWAYQTLMQYYPDNSYELYEERYENGNVMVHCTLTITVGEHSVSRYMWLPVLDFRNKPVTNPDAFQINSTRMRCLVKCISMFGLGAYIYAGEDIPQSEADAAQEEKSNLVSTITKEQAKLLGEAVEHAGRDLGKLMKFYKVNKLDELTKAQYDQALHACQKAIHEASAQEQL